MPQQTNKDEIEVQKAAHTGGWMINLTDNKITLVEETYRLFGLDKKTYDRSFKGLLKIVHPDDVKPLLNFGKELLETKKPDYFEIEHRIIRSDGKVRNFQEIFRTNFDDDGKLYMISGTASDITESQKAERALIESEERYKSIFNCSLAMLITVDNNRKITGFNPAAYKKFGYTPAEILKKDISILYINNEDEQAVSQSLAEKGKFVGRVTNVRKNGETFEAQLSASILYDADGNKVGTVGSSLELS